MSVGAVAIGRNEGPRLVRCLVSLAGRATPVVYVDSGSTDGSVATAEAAGALVVQLDRDRPFTAARARNAGAMRLFEAAPETAFIQFVDGDCALREGWIETAAAFLEAHPDIAVACGRRRERDPGASLWNRLIDREWDTPPGEAQACGGDAVIRAAAFRAVGGYDGRLIAGEEPELCVRLRLAGWRIWRLDAEMTWHDAGMTRVSQWWRRARRAGHAYAEGAALHGSGPLRHNVGSVRRSLFWGAALPLGALLGSVVTPWALALLTAYPAQAVRLARRESDSTAALFLVLAKFAEAIGIGEYWLGRLRGRGRTLIEYK